MSDAALCQAVAEIAQGLIDTDLGGNVVKKRVALPGRGKRGGARPLVATNKGDRWFFVFGFEKNERGNITDEERKGLRRVVEHLLNLKVAQLEEAVQDGSLKEICHDDKN